MLTRLAALAALLAGPLLISVLSGCSHAGPTASGAAGAAAAPARSNGAVTQSSGTFCTFITSTNATLTKASSQQGRVILATLAPKLRQEQSVAPASVSAEFAVVVAAVQQARAEGTLAPLATDQVATAGAGLTSYCHSRS